MGRVYGRVLFDVVQVVFFMLAGPILFGVDFGLSPGGVFLTLLVYVWVAASLGVMSG
jgi:hypothetical protein